MARKVLVRLVDDLDGLPSEDVATVTFSLDRVTYQIDLNETNAGKLRDGLASYIAAARRTGGRVRRGAPGRSPASGNDGPAIREWAREQGHELAERGRIPSHIVAAFREATRNGRSKAPSQVTAAVRPARTRQAAGTAKPATRATKTAAATRTAAKTTAKATTKATTKAATKAAPKSKPAAKNARAATTKATKATKATTRTAKPAARTKAATSRATKAADSGAKSTGRSATAKTPRSTASTAARGGRRASSAKQG